MSKWHYQGDTNLEYGGFFYTLEGVDYGYVDVVDVVPCSDAGGQDNAWWIEWGVIHLPTEGAAKVLFKDAGLDPDDYQGEAYSHILIGLTKGYYGVDMDSSLIVQIGPRDPFYGGNEYVNPERVLRSGTDLEKWVRRNFLQGE